MNPIKAIHKYVLTGSLAHGKFLIPAPPPRVPSQFILYITKEQQQYKQTTEKASQQDIIKLLKTQYKELSEEDKQLYKQQYDRLLIKYEQQKREYEWTYHLQRENKFQSWQSSFRRMAMSQKSILKNDLTITISESRDRFRIHQLQVKEELKNAPQEQIVIAEQLGHLSSLRTAQINVHYEQFKVPTIFNTKQGKEICQNYLKTHFRYNQIDLDFRQYLQNEILLTNYDDEIQMLAKQLSDDPRNLEFAIIYQLCNKKKIREEKIRKRRKPTKNGEKFLNLLTEYLEKD